jgi:hypothetical protein
MTSKKLGALLRSVPPATAATVPEPSSPSPASLAVEPASGGRIVRAAPTVEPEVPLQVLIPAGIRKQLALKAAEDGESLRALVLRGIRGLGIAVTDADIKGKRGRRSA